MAVVSFPLLFLFPFPYPYPYLSHFYFYLYFHFYLYFYFISIFQYAKGRIIIAPKMDYWRDTPNEHVLR